MELAPLAKEIKTLSESVSFIQDELGKSTDQMKGFELEKFEKASNDAADAVVRIQAIEDEQKAKDKKIEDEIAALTKKLARAGSKGGAEMSESDRAYKSEFARYLRKGVAMDSEGMGDIAREIVMKQYPDMSEEKMEMQVKDLVAGSNPDGGYYVRPEVANFLITKITETSNIRSVANIVTVGTDSLEIIVDDEDAVTGGWVGEVSPRGNTGTPQVGKQTIPVHEQFAQPRISQKMIDDAGLDVEAWLQSKVAAEFSRTENTAFIRGDGAEKPKGILSYADAADPDVYQRNLLGTRIAGGAAISGDDMKFLQNNLKEEYQANAIFAMRRKSFGNIITLKDDDGQYIFSSRFLSDRDAPSLLGKDVRFWDDLDDVAATAIPVVYGDFGRGYTIVDRFGIRVIRDEVTEKPYILLYTTKRVGGDVTNYDSIKRLRMPV